MRQLKLLSRFHVLFILLSVLSAFVIVQGIWSRNQARHIESNISTRTMPILRFQMNVLQMQRWLANTAAGGDESYITGALEKAGFYESGARSILKEQIFDHGLPVDLHNDLVELQRNLIICYTKGRRMAEAYLNEDSASAQLAAGDFNDHAEMFTRYVDSLVDREIRDLYQHMATVNNRTDTIIFLSALMIAAFIVLGIFSRRMNRQYTDELESEIDDRKRAQRALRESEEKYRLLVENAEDAIFIARDGFIIFSNSKTSAIIGYTVSELKQIPFLQMIHPEDRDMVMKRHIQRLEGKQPPSTYTFRVLNKNNDVLWVHLNAVLIQWEENPATLNFLRDITRQREIENRIQQAQKLEAMGILAGGIAHDFNNLLMGIQGRVSLMLADKDVHSDDFENLREIEDHIKSAAGLTRQMLGFARGGKYELNVVNMNDVLNQSMRMFGRTRKEVRMIQEFDQDIWSVEVDRSQIDQVFLNLYVNAWQAMAGGGEIRVRTQNEMIDANMETTDQAVRGRYVKISVTDNGCGIEDAYIDKIFDPFFTTKDQGRGTGLGLASAYGIVRNHGGMISAESRLGRGTTFHIFLPASVKETSGSSHEMHTRPSGGSGSILLIDDEQIVATVTEKMLETLGYHVICATDGKAAIELFVEHHPTIDLVILDMIMPDMDGGEVFDRLRSIDENVRILLSSGYSLNGQAMEIMKRGCSGFIQKPFDLGQLSEKVRSVLS